MAIQLNERDYLIFRLLQEHTMLLEKQIAWFISTDSKPVLIRDRLRKLFYLDYVICQRHAETLPWWTTPTKPLVYALSHLSRALVAPYDDPIDLNDSQHIRHLLEIANIRMLLAIDEKEGRTQELDWMSSRTAGGHFTLDARAEFVRLGVRHRIGILNNPQVSAQALVDILQKATDSDDVDLIWIITSDEDRQKQLQLAMTAQLNASGSSMNTICAFATHQELYTEGIVKSRWTNIEGRRASIFVESIEDARSAGAAARICSA